MDLNLLLGGESFFHEELGNSFSVVSLQLDNLSESLVIDHRSIATPALLEMSHKLFEVDVIWESLDDRDALSNSTLLELNMDHVLFYCSCVVSFVSGTWLLVKLILHQIVLKEIFFFHVVFYYTLRN